MELSDLQIFRTVVQTGGILRAAESLHRAQSSVTARIQALEEKLAAPLFIREGRRLQLAPAGRVLLQYADRLLDLAKEAGEAVKLDQPSGTLRLGAMESTAAVRLPQPLGRFHDAHPDVALELYIGDPTEHTRQVLGGELDAALVAIAVSDKRLASVAVYEEEMVLISEAKHAPIASPKDVHDAKSLLVFHPGCPHRKRFEDWFARAHVSPQQRMVEVGSYHAILGCVAIGMGVALVPASVLDTYSERARLAVHRLSPKFRYAHTRLIWRKDAPQAKIAALCKVLAPQKPAAKR
ncbi:LysR family transcriptional regulator [Variovorax sp. ZS18.2.2]|uniref:LysR family transcriptional regulator n=1 Tax=Variovorax sp. ZS18.2.2 TaxID=2971255 RepID=UPI0021508E80|nr:LysR family transcriptional regulator [Variovorax sp. ZS18.2.2]MCR6476912.1 LysR family transcriptional regulator [Variovorax sp. ZS18.2.2]